MSRKKINIWTIGAIFGWTTYRETGMQTVISEFEVQGFRFSIRGEVQFS